MYYHPGICELSTNNDFILPSKCTWSYTARPFAGPPSMRQSARRLLLLSAVTMTRRNGMVTCNRCDSPVKIDTVPIHRKRAKIAFRVSRYRFGQANRLSCAMLRVAHICVCVCVGKLLPPKVKVRTFSARLERTSRRNVARVDGNRETCDSLISRTISQSENITSRNEIY